LSRELRDADGLPGLEKLSPRMTAHGLTRLVLIELAVLGELLLGVEGGSTL
jgi:hypothetical protein